MMRKSRILIVAALLALCPKVVKAEDGAYLGYAPYSMFAIGDISNINSAYNRTMGGVGIATRNHKYLNPLNPASIVVRDSLSFMADFSFYENNKIFSQAGRTSANNTFNMGDIAFSFPAFRNTAMMVGITPYSTTGYSLGSYVTDPKIISEHGTTIDSFTGKGSLYQAYGAFAWAPFKNFSAGAQYALIFGNIEKVYKRSFEKEDTRSVSETINAPLKAGQLKFGMQYEQKFGKKTSVTLGATYSLESALKIASDSTSFKPLGATIAPELGVGIAFTYGEKMRGEFNYTRSDWRNSGLDNWDTNKHFSTSVSEAYRLGFEYIPNYNDIRYYMKRVSYRAGAYYKTEYYSYAGSPVASAGITLGMTLPVFRWYNGISLGVDLGRRGDLAGKGVTETYAGFFFGLNLFDIWFQQPRYD